MFFQNHCVREDPPTRSPYSIDPQKLNKQRKKYENKSITMMIASLTLTLSSISYAESYNNVLVLQPGQSMYMSSPQLVVCTMQQIIQDQVFIRSIQSDRVSGKSKDFGKCSGYNNEGSAANRAALTAIGSVKAECEATTGKSCEAFVISSTPYESTTGYTHCDIQAKAVAKK